MNLADLWRKVLRLESEVQQDGRRLTRRDLRERFKLGERDARFLYECLKNRQIIGGKDASATARTADNLKNTKADLAASQREIVRLQRKVELLSDLREQHLNIPRMLLPGAGKKGEVIATAVMSDAHFDEHVVSAEIDFVNGYDREIAGARLEKYYRSIVRLGRDYCGGVTISGLVHPLAGDLVSGIIHDELKASNCYPMSETLLHYSTKIASGMLMLLEFYKEIFVPCVVGNHGRFTPHFIHKGAVQDNYDYLLYNMIARELQGEKHIKFFIPLSPDAIYPVYSTKYCLTHGNQFRGGSGWMGPLGPVMRGDVKKKGRQAAVGKPYDIMVCGHFHSQHTLGGCIMSGSMVGYSEYASNGNFPYEQPQQPFWLTDPEHGVTLSAPIHCKCDDEPWEKSING